MSLLGFAHLFDQIKSIVEFTHNGHCAVVQRVARYRDDLIKLCVFCTARHPAVFSEFVLFGPADRYDINRAFG